MAFLRERRRKSVKHRAGKLLEAWDVQGAIQILRDHVADDQDDTGAVVALADLLRGCDPEAALAMMQDLADRFPHDWAVWAQFGQLACKLERWQLADETYQHALSLNPPESEPRYTLHFQRGLVADEMGKPEVALLHYRHAQAERADDPDLWFNRGNTLLQARRFDEALTSYDTALRLSPEDYRIARQRAMALRGLE
jgi:tetratricopeptide (TPR) repeat protein